MKISYTDDFPPLRVHGLHWLSPAHGPGPDHIGLVSYQTETLDEQFLCALWCRGSCIIVALEIIDKTRTKEEVEEVSHLCGWLLHTLRWALVEKELRCEDESVPLDEGDEEDDVEWRLDVYRQVMTSSVRKAIRTPSGADMMCIT
jgi:hypothetical protein